MWQHLKILETMQKIRNKREKYICRLENDILVTLKTTLNEFVSYNMILARYMEVDVLFSSQMSFYHKKGIKSNYREWYV